MFIRVPILFCVTALAACGTSTTPLPPLGYAAKPADDNKRTAPKASAFTRKPVTVLVPTSGEVNEKISVAIGADTPRPVTLSLRGVRVPDNWNPKNSIHVFVNNPEATPDTSPDDPSFVFSFYLSPLDPEQPQNFGFDLAPALARLKKNQKWKPAETIPVTFVVVPPANATLPGELRVPFQEVGLSVPVKP